MKNGNPEIGQRKWKAFKTSLVYFTAFDVFNIITLLAAVRFELLPKDAIAELWNVLIIQWFLGVGAIIVAFMGGNAAAHFAKRKENGNGG